MHSYGTILVVEDDPNDYSLVELACRRADIYMPLVRVDDGVQAREYLSSEGAFADRGRFPIPKIILADLKMPRMSGLELLAWLRSQPTLKCIPFVVLSASAQENDIAAAYELGANSYLVKPMKLDDLTSLLRQFKIYWLELNRYPDGRPKVPQT